MTDPQQRLVPELGVDGRHRCPECRALVTKDAPFCGMCHASFAWSGGGGAPGPTTWSSRPRVVEHAECPRGHGPLRFESVADINVHACSSCAGMLIEKTSQASAMETVESIVALLAFAEELSSAATASVNGSQISYIKCPACGGSTARKNFERVSGVVVDVCVTHGTWLDGGEYSRIVEFLKNGGLAKKSRFEEREAETTKREREAIRELDRRYRQELGSRRPGLGSFAARHLLDED